MTDREALFLAYGALLASKDKHPVIALIESCLFEKVRIPKYDPVDLLKPLKYPESENPKL